MVSSAYMSGCLGVRCCRLALSSLFRGPPATLSLLLRHRYQYIHPHLYGISHTPPDSTCSNLSYPSFSFYPYTDNQPWHRQSQTLPLPFRIVHCILMLSVTKKCLHYHDPYSPLQAIYFKLTSSALLTQPSSFSSVAIYPPSSMGKGPKKKHHKQRLEQLSAATSYVAYWARGSKSSFSTMGTSTSLREWIPPDTFSLSNKPLIIDLHTHSTCSDGMLSPVQLVEKAAASGVQVLALTDHDTMVGVPAAFETANRLGIRLIPGVEISAKVTAKTKNGFEEPVHILGYYSCCGPGRWQELEAVLARIREGRHHRAHSMISKLKSLNKPVTWESVVMIAGAGVAPGRLHIARALVEAGHVYSLREAFNKYLYDGGPAYAPGCELAAEDAVRLICDTGGVAVLAHPWSLKDALPVVKRLKEVGLQAMEVYRGDGRANGFAVLAKTFELLMLGGSDFHGRGEPDEVKLGKVSLPLLAIGEFLQVAEPIWRIAVNDLLRKFAEESFQITTEKIAGAKYFNGVESFKGDLVLDHAVEKEGHKVSLRLSSWLTEEDRLAVQEAATQLKLQIDIVVENGRSQCIISRQIK